MDILRMTLNDAGRVEFFEPDFKVVRGSYGNILLNVEVPETLLVDAVKDTTTGNIVTGNNVRIGAIIRTSIGQNLKTPKYELKAIKTYLFNGKKYVLFQRKMPKVFTMWETVSQLEEATPGLLEMVVNVTNWKLNSIGAKIEENVACPILTLPIYPSTELEEGEEIPNPSDFDLLQGEVNSIRSQVNEIDQTLDGNVEGLNALAAIVDNKVTKTEKVAEGKVLVSNGEGGMKPSSVPIKEFEDQKSYIDKHLADKNNPHNVSAEQVGLGNVNNTSDEDKPVSKAQSEAISVVQNSVDTHKARVDNPHSVTKAQVGLGNVDNTSDADKPISTVQQTALDLKADKTAVTEEIASAISAVVDDAPEAFDTFKEIAEWISQDETGTAALVSRVASIENKNAEQDTSISNLAERTTTNETDVNAIKTKLDTIENGAEANVQPDWNQEDTTADDFIKNKPNIPEGAKLYSSTGDNTDGAMTQQAVTNIFAKQSDLPTDLGDLTNTAGYAKVSQVPTKTSQLQNDSNFLDKDNELYVKNIGYTDNSTSFGPVFITNKTFNDVSNTLYIKFKKSDFNHTVSLGGGASSENIELKDVVRTIQGNENANKMLSTNSEGVVESTNIIKLENDVKIYSEKDTSSGEVSFVIEFPDEEA